MVKLEVLRMVVDNVLVVVGGGANCVDGGD